LIESNKPQNLNQKAAEQYIFNRSKNKLADKFVLEPMNPLIKISNQSAKILRNYTECRIRRFNSNNKLLRTRLFPINILNRYASSDYRKMY